MSPSRRESEPQETVVRTIPKFSSFRPPPTSSENQTGGSGGPVQHSVPKFSSFIPPVQGPESSVPFNAASDSDRAGPRHRDCQRSSSRHRDRSRERGHRHHRSKERRREHDKEHYREGSRERTSHQDNRKRSKIREREKERHRDRELSRRHRAREVDEDESRNRKEPVPKATTGDILPWDDENPSGAKPFYINTKGDPANLIYGTIHRYSIPQYHRYGKGSIVGLSPDIRIIQDKGDGKGLVLASRTEHAEHYKRGVHGERKYRFALPDANGTRRLKVITKADRGEGGKPGTEFDRGLEYVPLLSRRIKNGVQDSNEENMHERLLFHLAGDRNQYPEDEDLEYASESDDEMDEMSPWNSDQIRQKQLEIQRRVDSTPSDISAWLGLVAHQDKVLYSGDGRKKRATIAERKSTAEIKLSILDKALGKIPQDDWKGRETLWEYWFDVAGETWEPERLLSKYRSTLRQYPTMHSVWVKYLNFRQTDFDSFRYSEMIGCYEQCLEVLRTAIHNKDKSDQDIPRLEEIALYVIFRGLILTREAGYIELSIASLQGLLELNLFAPKNVLSQYPLSSHAAYDSTMEQLRDFWDAEVLRAGEEGAEGWYRYVERGNEGPVPERVRKEGAEEDDMEIDRDDPFGWWIQKETNATERRGAWPARVVDEAEEDDPFNVVLSTDIMRWMFCLSNENVRRLLVTRMLEFCGLPGCFLAQEQESEKETDSHLDTFLCGYGLGSGRWFWPQRDEKPGKLITWEGMEPERQGDIMDELFGFKLNNGYPITTDMLFGRQNGEWAYFLREISNSGDPLTANIHIARRVLKMLIDGPVMDYRYSEKLALFYWALEWWTDPVKAQKLAKKLLKKYRTSLLLYSAYAQIEWRMGNIDAARKIFSTALGMCGSSSEGSRRDSILLWRTWTWEEIMDGNKSEALSVLLSIPSGRFSGDREEHDSAFSNAARLRAKRFLQEEQDRLASLGSLKYAFAYNEAMALMEYLFPSAESKNITLDVSSALPIYDSLLKELRDRGLSNSRPYEIGLMNGKIRLLYHHARTSRSFRMAFLREALEEAIVEVKQSSRKVNTLLWSLYAWNEGRSRIEGRIRGWLKDQVIGPGGKESTVAGYGFAIWAESRMTGNNVHAVRKLFDEAVDCPSTKASVALWKRYIEFEIREREPTRAKLALFRALRCCPWSKDIAMLAFTKLMPVLGFEELKKVLAIATTEKELRVYDTTTLEDFLEDLGDEGGPALYPGISGVGGSKRQKVINVLEDASPHSEGEMDED
ncbi:NRDE-2, necessary for RNA interference-domain-containing protein [Terfezia claveryi]|nr:NRDE-2, necessary for RNA interference-domain-containing protein [Terfezia claveryi]